MRVTSRISAWHSAQEGGWGNVTPDTVLKDSFGASSGKRHPVIPVPQKILKRKAGVRSEAFYSTLAQAVRIALALLRKPDDPLGDQLGCRASAIS